MNIETVDELCEHLADLIGVYGCCRHAESNEDCKEKMITCCRVGFMIEMPDRIRQAVINDEKLKIFQS